MAHLQARATRRDPESRLQWKLRLIRRLILRLNRIRLLILRLLRIRLIGRRAHARRVGRIGQRLARNGRNAAGRAQLVGKADRRPFADRRNFQGKIRAADAGPGNRLDARERGAFLHLSGLETCDLGLMPPRVALREHHLAAGSETEDDDGADEIPGYSTRHARTMRRNSLGML